MIGERCRIGASVVIDGWTEIGDETQIYPMASIGLAPQDLKYKGERTRLTIGRRNIFREFVTINRGTLGGGGQTTIGDSNLFMAYVHVAHDCHIGNDTIFGPHATLGGHVDVEDFANDQRRIGACTSSAASAATPSSAAIPWSPRTRCRSADDRQPAGAHLRRQHDRPVAPRLHAGHDRAAEAGVPLPAAVEAEHVARAGPDRAGPDATSPEVRYLVDFIRSSQRGVILRRADALGAEELRRRRHEARACIAGNGRFPFLVLDAARAQGHDVTVIAAKEETFPELNDAAARHGVGDPLDLARPARQVHQPAQGGRRHARRDGGAGQAHEDLPAASFPT